MYYAQLTNSVVTSVTQTHSSLPESPNLVQIDSYDTSLLGHSYDGEAFHAPEPMPEPRHISVGAFYDRFGPAKWAILADTTPGVVAVIRDSSVRAYIDLKHPQLPGGLAIIEAAGHVFDAAAVINDPVLESERP